MKEAAQPGNGSGFRHTETVEFAGGKLKRFVLGNGLSLLFLQDKQAPVFSYHSWFKIGSRHEKHGKTGLAHFFEHLMFGETANAKAGVFDRKLEESGAESNAATWVDWTFYHEALPKDRLKLVAKLEADRMQNLVLKEPQVTSEKEVTNERRYRVEDDVEGAAGEELYKLAFQKHGYGWPTIGWMADIAGYTPEDCALFYKTYYAPNNVTLVICGDLSESAVLKTIEAAYGAIPAADIPPEDIVPEPPQTEERTLDLKKPTAAAKLILGYRGPALGDPDHVTLSVLSEILFGGRASRLHQKLVTELEVVSDVRSWVSTFRDPGLFEMWFTARSGISLERIQELVEPLLEEACREVATSEELERAKARIELSMLQGLDTANGKAEQIGFNETVLGDPNASLRKLGQVRRLTVGEIRTCARRYLVRTARTVLRIFPEDPKPETAATPVGSN
jgi:zinc protease